MTTRAEDYRTQQLREHPSTRAKKARAKARVRTEHQAKARLDHATHETHNEAKRAELRSAYPLETGTRKSSRGGANRSKTDSSMRKTATSRTPSPGMRATRQKEGGGARKRH
jgi:sarcosine oxidase gamma subunit